MIKNKGMENKTKKCDWCNKRKKDKDICLIGKVKETDKSNRSKMSSSSPVFNLSQLSSS